jgi:hypothetical protein
MYLAISVCIGYILRVPEPEPQPARPRRAPAAIVTVIALTVAGAATTAILLTGGSPARPPTAAQAARQRAIATARALDVGRGTPRVVRRPQLRLGILAQPGDATALTGLRLGYYSLQLSATGTQLAAQPYTSPAAEETALTAGRLDAAYLSPVAAVQAWQNTRGNIRIIAGAATRSSATTAVLAVTTTYLTRHPLQVQELLKAHIQAATLLTIDPAAGRAAAAAELTSADTPTMRARQISAALALVTATCNPGAPSVLAQARAAAGQLKPLTSLAGIYNLTPLNQLLKATGQATVTS